MLGRPSAKSSQNRRVRRASAPAPERLEPKQLLALFTVTSNGDTGGGSLRDAIDSANRSPGADVIAFAIAPGGQQTISLQTPLSPITEPVTINGYSQTGFNPTDPMPMIELDGSGAGSNASGLILLASSGASTPGGIGSVVRGLAINGFDNNGISISGDGHLVEGNVIGLGIDGVTALPNLGRGIDLSNAHQVTIGGASDLTRNVISGNGANGIRIRGLRSTDASANEIVGNYIGTDRTGAIAVGNGSDGIQFFGGGLNTVGGRIPGQGNLISGNGGYGIFFNGIAANGNLVIGNKIGTDLAGTQAIANSDGGIFGLGNSNTIGGAESGDRNLISGNSGPGVSFQGSQSDTNGPVPNIVQGNYIGTAEDGTSGLGNLSAGVELFTTAAMVGGDSPEAGNRIAFTTPDVFGNAAGVALILSSNRNTILSNQIFANGALGIAFNNSKVPLPNDPMDADSSSGDGLSNEGQNYPVITAVRAGGGVTEIEGTINSTPNTSLLIQFFASDLPDPSGFGEGQAYLGKTDVVTDGNGDASFSVLFNGQVGANQVVTSTATGDGNTSEFSGAASVAILPATDLAVSSTATPDPVGVGNDMTISVTIDNGGPGDANGVVATATLPAGSTFVSSPDGFTPNSSGQLVANVGSIAAGGSTTVSYVIRPAFVGSFAASVTVDNDEIDPVVANNIASASFDVEPNSGQSVFAFSAASYDIGEPGGSLTVTVTRSNGTAAASVQYATSAGTATPDADYLPTAATLNFAEGELSKSFEVPIINDLLIEGTETIGLVLSDPTNGAVLGQPFNAVVNILDDDPTPPPTGQFRLGATTFTFVEGTPFATIPVERVGGVEGEARVHFRTVDGTAKAGSDYTPFDFELIFSAGDNAPKLVLVPLIDDAIPENPESFSVSLSNATGAPIGSPSTATVTIDDDDPFPIPPDQQTISLGAAQYSVAENVSQAAIIVQRSSGSGVVSVRVRTADAAGAANTRYLPVDTVVTFEDGELLKTVPVVLINNTVADGNVDVAVTLSDPTGGPALGDPSVTVLTIVDDDTDGTPPPAASSTIQFAARTTTVDESAGLASLTLTRSGNLTSQVTLTIVPRAGDAQAGVDYDVTPISVVFAAGQSSATISVPIIDDTIADGDRAFGLFITDVVDAGGVTVNLGTIDSAIVVVQDNDAVSPGVPGGPTVVNVFFVGPTSAPSGIGITLSEPLMTAPDAGAFAIVSSGRDQRFGTADDRVIAISSVGYDALANQVVLATSTPLRLGQTYRLAVDGVTDLALRDLAGAPLDGDADGLSGGYYLADLSRASFHRYLDADGDQVRLLLQGGLLDVIRPIGANPEIVRVAQSSPSRAVLLGDVQRRRPGSNGTTTIGRLEGIDPFGVIRVRLTTPPFLIGSVTPSAVDVLFGSPQVGGDDLLT